MDQSTIKKDTSSSELSVPRVGMKRELISVLKTREEMGELPMVRRRVTMQQNLGISALEDVSSDSFGEGEVKGKVSGSPTTRKVQNNAVEDNVVALPKINAPKESGGENIPTVETEMVVQERDVGVPDAECYIPNFDETEPLQFVDLDSLTEYEKQLLVDDDRFLAEFVTPYNFDLGQGSNEEAAHGVVNDGVLDNVANVPQGTEMNVSTGIEFTEVPKRLKDLLETRLLEGLRVRYIHGSKGRKSILVGYIQGTRVLCSCVQCEGKVAVTPNEFELHAHSRNKRPSESIYLDNGKSLKDILNACKDGELDLLELLIREAIGRSDETK